MEVFYSPNTAGKLKYIRSFMKLPLLEKEFEKKLTQSWCDSHNEQALHILIKSYIKLVIRLALRYRHYGLPVEDLIQEGIIGLLQAAVKFDPSRDVRFSSYTKWWVKAAIQDFIFKNWSIVKVGLSPLQKVLFFNLNRLKSQLLSLQKEGAPASPQEQFSCLLKISPQDIERIENRLLKNDLSLNAKIREESDHQWQDMLSDDRPSPEEISLGHYDSQACQKWLLKALTCLNSLERTIITKRWLTEDPETLEEISRTLNLTKQKVKLFEMRSIRKLRHYLVTHLQGARHLL